MNAYAVMGMHDMYERSGHDCVICGSVSGTIVTADGFICPSCMPVDLIRNASKTTLQRIILYRRTHSDFISCSEEHNSDSQPSGNEDFDRSMLFTAKTYGTLADELNRQFLSSSSADLIISFIKLSGTSLLIDSIKTMARHGKIRIITTAYMGVTEAEAIYELAALPNTEVRIELKTNDRPIHAKSMLFTRADGSDIAFVGSANFSKSALTSGEEWVVKLKGIDVPQIISDLKNAFEDMWNSSTLKKVITLNKADIEKALQSYGR